MKSPAWRRRAFQGGKCGVIQGSPVHADNFEQRPTFHGSASVANATAQGLAERRSARLTHPRPFQMALLQSLFQRELDDESLQLQGPALARP